MCVLSNQSNVYTECRRITAPAKPMKLFCIVSVTQIDNMSILRNSSNDK